MAVPPILLSIMHLRKVPYSAYFTLKKFWSAVEATKLKQFSCYCGLLLIDRMHTEKLRIRCLACEHSCMKRTDLIMFGLHLTRRPAVPTIWKATPGLLKSSDYRAFFITVKNTSKWKSPFACLVALRQDFPVNLSD